MEYRKFEKLSWKPSLLGFGCMRLPVDSEGNIDQNETERMFKYAIENGVTYFDTAYMYHGGESEVVVGNVLKKFPRSSYTLTTKLPVWLIEEEDDILRIFNEQLEKTKEEYFDVYLLHAIDKNKYDHIKSLNVFPKLLKLKGEGKIKHIGFSFHGSYSDFEYIVKDGIDFWNIVQIQLNYMDIDIQQGIKGYELLEANNIPVLIMEPVKGGSLSRLPKDISSLVFEHKPDSSISSWAFRWLFKYKNISTILSGMSSFEQISDNIKTFNEYQLLNEQEEEIINNVRTKLKERIFVPCTGCGYCVPCPKGVKINNVFAKYNEMYMYEKYSDWDVDTLKKMNVESCVNCGICVKKCPQNINIPLFIRKINDYINHKK